MRLHCSATTTFIQNFFFFSNWIPYPLNNNYPLLFPASLATTVLLSVSINLTSLDTLSMWYRRVCVLFNFFISLGVMSSKGLPIFKLVPGFPSSLRLHNIPLYALYTTLHFYLFIHWLTCFHLLANVNALNMDGKILAQIATFNSFEYMPRSRSYGNSILIFEESHFVFHSSCISHSDQQCTRAWFLHLLANIYFCLFG